MPSVLGASEHVVDPADHQDLSRRDVLRHREAGHEFLRELDEGVAALHRIDMGATDQA